jgi:hypothetical protein
MATQTEVAQAELAQAHDQAVAPVTADSTIPSQALDILNIGHGTSLRFEGDILIVKGGISHGALSSSHC